MTAPSQEARKRIFAIRSAMQDRADGFGLMAKMSNERFARYVARQLELFEEAREEVASAT